MAQVMNSREAGATSLRHVWVLQNTGPDGSTSDPVVCATRDVARSRTTAEAEGVDLAWEENGLGAVLVADGQEGGLGAVLDAELGQHGAHVRLHGLLGH